MLSNAELFSDDAMLYLRGEWPAMISSDAADKIQKHLLTKGGSIATKKLPSELEKLMQEETF